MNQSDVLQKINDDKQTATEKNSYAIDMINRITPTRDLLSVESLRVGDTFFYKVVGGKSRPWVALWVRKGFVGCASLTHSDLEAGCKCECRFWRDNYIGPTLTILPVERVLDAVYYPYTNLKHLKQVRESIKKQWEN